MSPRRWLPGVLSFGLALTAHAEDMNRSCGQSFLRLARSSRAVHFDAEGDFRDMSGNGFYGTGNQATFATDSRGGQSWSFALASSEVRVPYSALLDFDTDDTFTISMWVHTSTSETAAELLHGPLHQRRYPYRLYLNGGQLNFCVSDGAETVCQAVDYRGNTDQWTLVVASKLGGGLGRQVCLSLDGGALQCNAIPAGFGSIRAGDGELVVGRHPSGVNDFRGRIDELRIFSERLHPAFLSDTYAAGVQTYTCLEACDRQGWKGRFDVYCGPGQSQEFCQTIVEDQKYYFYWANIKMRGYIDMYLATSDAAYLDQAKLLARHFLDELVEVEVNDDSGAREFRQDDRGCLSRNAYTCPLDTERGYRELTHLALLLKQDCVLYGENRSLVDEIIAATKDDLINNALFENRFKKQFHQVHHIVSHQALTLVNLYEVTGDTQYRAWASPKIVAMQTSTFPAADGTNSIAWGKTDCVGLVDDNPACYCMNDAYNRTNCIDDEGHGHCYAMDTAHSNDYVDAVQSLAARGYMPQAYVDSLRYTLREVMLRGTEPPAFSTNVNGQEIPEPADCPSGETINTSYVRSSLAPGWIGLAAADESLQQIFVRMEDPVDPQLLVKQRMSFFAGMLLNRARLGALPPTDAGLIHDTGSNPDTGDRDSLTTPDAGMRDREAPDLASARDVSTRDVRHHDVTQGDQGRSDTDSADAATSGDIFTPSSGCACGWQGSPWRADLVLGALLALYLGWVLRTRGG